MFDSLMQTVLRTIDGNRIRGVVGSNTDVGQTIQLVAPYLLDLPIRAAVDSGTVVKYAEKYFLLGDTITEAGYRRMRMFEVSGPYTWTRIVTEADAVSKLDKKTTTTTVSKAAYAGVWRLGDLQDVTASRASKWTLIGPAGLQSGDVINGYTIDRVDTSHEGVAFAEAR